MKLISILSLVVLLVGCGEYEYKPRIIVNYTESNGTMVSKVVIFDNAQDAANFILQQPTNAVIHQDMRLQPRK